MRSTVVLPEPEGPTRTTNSPSGDLEVERPRPRRCRPANTFFSSSILDRPPFSRPLPLLLCGDQVAVPERAALRASRRCVSIVDVDDPEALASSPAPTRSCRAATRRSSRARPRRRRSRARRRARCSLEVRDAGSGPRRPRRRSSRSSKAAPFSVMRAARRRSRAQAQQQLRQRRRATTASPSRCARRPAGRSTQSRARTAARRVGRDRGRPVEVDAEEVDAAARSSRGRRAESTSSGPKLPLVELEHVGAGSAPRKIGSRNQPVVLAVERAARPRGPRARRCTAGTVRSSVMPIRPASPGVAEGADDRAPCASSGWCAAATPRGQSRRAGRLRRRTRSRGTT